MNRGNIKKLAALAIISLWTLPSLCLAAHQHPEKYYQEKWCAEHNGQAEVVLADKTRADCITDTHVIEFDFARKWYEAVGQSLYYGRDCQPQRVARPHTGGPGYARPDAHQLRAHRIAR